MTKRDVMVLLNRMLTAGHAAVGGTGCNREEFYCPQCSEEQQDICGGLLEDAVFAAFTAELEAHNGGQ